MNKRIVKRIRAIQQSIPSVPAEEAVVIPSIMSGITILNAPKRKRGRPAKSRLPVEPKARGRKIKWTDLQRQLLLSYVKQYRSDHPGTLDADALRAYRSELAEQIGVHHLSRLLPSLKTLQNNLSIARQSFPEKSS